MSKQKFTVTLADTATEAAPQGLVTLTDVIKVPADEQVENAALDYAVELGKKHDTHYLVVGIERGA